MRIEKPLPPQGYLRECFHYEPTTGQLVWRTRPRSHFSSDRMWKKWNYQWSGECAGMVNPKGYLMVKLGEGSAYVVSRIIFKWMTGNEPVQWMDHRDGDPTNNRWENLRQATAAQNAKNHTKRQMQGTHKLPSGRFEARFQKDHHYIYLGIFPTAETAHAAYVEATRSHFGKFARD